MTDFIIQDMCNLNSRIDYYTECYRFIFYKKKSIYTAKY